MRPAQIRQASRAIFSPFPALCVKPACVLTVCEVFLLLQFSHPLSRDVVVLSAQMLQAYEAQSFLVSAQDAHHAAQEHVNAHQHVRSCLNLLVKHMELGWLLTSFLFIRDSDEDVEQPSKIKFAYIL